MFLASHALSSPAAGITDEGRSVPRDRFEAVEVRAVASTLYPFFPWFQGLLRVIGACVYLMCPASDWCQ